MPGTEQASSNSTPFADVIDVLLARLAAKFTEEDADAPSLPIAWTALPENELHTYTAQDGLLVHVGPPVPMPKCGAGRYNMRVSRFVTVVVLTQSLSDPAGSDLEAVKAHVTREESVTDALHLIGPIGATYNLRTGIMSEWVEGGNEIARQVKSDPGQLKSGLRFRVEYVSPMQVIRA